MFVFAVRGATKVLPVLFRGSPASARIIPDEIGDFGLRGPRTAHWCIKFLQRQKMHPDDYHQCWASRLKLTAADWGVTAHGNALRAVCLAGCLDQLDIPNLCIIEHLLREAQLVEHHYNKNIERDAMVCPELTEWIGKQKVAKQARTPREEQTRKKAREEQMEPPI